jgi:RHS repeat-associated protein
VIQRGATQIADYDYVGPGERVSRMIYETGANDVTFAPGYDGMGRVTRMPWDRNGTLIAGFNYTFDKASNITKKVLDHRASDPSEDYTIDGLYRLTNALYNQRSLTHGFTYDDLGNRLTYDNNANQTTYHFNGVNELTKVDSTQVYYDKNGNLTKDASSGGGGNGPFVFYYDRQNQLTRIEDSSAAAVASYAYDALGRRIEKIDHKASETLRFYHDGQRSIEETDDAGTPAVQRYYVFGNYIDELILMRDVIGAGATANADFVFAHDYLYSPVAAIAKADGTITERYEYDAYGKPYILDADYTVDGSSDIANPYLVTGRQLDTLDSGAFLIQYSRARYYDYETGRWYQRDPLNQDKPGGGYHDGMGLYEYVKNNPIITGDPLGLFMPPWGMPPGHPGAPPPSLVDPREYPVFHPIPSPPIGPVTPLPNTSSQCDDYECDDTYAGANARCFCKCAGNDPWSQYVRGCLRKLYDAGISAGEAHSRCYKSADDQNFPGGRPWMDLANCYVTCLAETVRRSGVGAVFDPVSGIQ